MMQRGDRGERMGPLGSKGFLMMMVNQRDRSIDEGEARGAGLTYHIVYLVVAPC